MPIPPHILQTLQGITVLRTEHGNVIARDDKDNQEFVFAECSSPDIAACILVMVKMLTGETNECE
ncbi:TraS protein [Pectobacterium atrosepticum]|uniref:TraS protein n=1 Tax=Pectobacterium atrosepticum TaxID=29471 RepID=UPI00301AB719